MRIPKEGEYWWVELKGAVRWFASNSAQSTQGIMLIDWVSKDSLVYEGVAFTTDKNRPQSERVARGQDLLLRPASQQYLKDAKILKKL